MKIDKEKFSKLKQLDRIEYRQKEDRIKNYLDSNCLFLIMKLFFLFAFFIILLAPQGYMLWGQEFIDDLFEAVRIIFGMMIFLAVIGASADVIALVFRLKYLRELQEEYFTSNVEVKK